MQLELRSSLKEKCQQFHEQGQLVSAQKVSQFIADVLLKTSDHDFSSKEWRFEP